MVLEGCVLIVFLTASVDWLKLSPHSPYFSTMAMIYKSLGQKGFM